MVAKDIVEMLKTGDPGDLDPDTAAEIYAHILALMQDLLTPSDLQRLILIGTVMYQNSVRAHQLQIPGGQKPDRSVEPLGPLM